LPDTKSNLRLDKRLIRRRGWISSEDLRRELDSLPDVSAKIQPPEEPGAGAAKPTDSTGGA
jgi:hypothetical protein